AALEAPAPSAPPAAASASDADERPSTSFASNSTLNGTASTDSPHKVVHRGIFRRRLLVRQSASCEPTGTDTGDSPRKNIRCSPSHSFFPRFFHRRRSSTTSPLKMPRSTTTANVSENTGAPPPQKKKSMSMKKSLSEYVIGCEAVAGRGAQMATLAVPGPSTSSAFLTPEPSPNTGRRMSILARLKERSVSELSLVVEAFRQGAGSPSAASGLGPTSTSTPVLAPAPSLKKKKGRRRRKVKSTWAAMQPSNIHRAILNVQEEKAMQAVPAAPIDASKFVAYVTERRKKRILFKGEYLMIQRSIDPNRSKTDIGASMGDRNPYPDTMPYDNNRVILTSKTSDSEDRSTYINASYVNSWLRERAYVVTQAVKSKPMNAEFWRMVWELGSNCIVMLTKVFDFMRVMCLQYWPLNKFQFDEIEVETLETKTYAHFVIRTFRLTKQTEDGKETRVIKHFHFTEWELDSFPYISAFIELRRRVRQYTEKNFADAPIIVHCSNGAGRSGAFLALDANLELMKKTGQVDVFEYAKQLVNARPHLIDSVGQYQFIYDALAEAVMCNIQPIAMQKLKERSSMYRMKSDRQNMETQDSHENKLLMMLTNTLRIGDCAGGHRLENRGKNRDIMVVPPDHARPYLQTLHGESKDYTYINAVEVDGFTRKAEFIVTEWPKPSTLDSFWTLVYDHSCHTIVNLSNQPNHRMYPTFIHNKGKANYGPFVVEVLNYHQYPSMTSHMVKVMKRTGNDSPADSRSASPGRFFGFGRASTPPKLPTLEGHPAYRPPPRAIPLGQSFRFKREYRGKIRHSTSDVFENGLGSDDDASPHADEADDAAFVARLRAAQDAARVSGLPPRAPPRRLRRAAHSAPPKVKPPPPDPFEEALNKGAADIQRLLNNRKPTHADPSRDQVQKLTFMISDIMSSGASQQQIEAEVRICCVIQVRMWPLESKVPLSTSGLMDVIKMARSWRKRAPDRPETKPTIVMSHNGFSRCGVFIGANVCIDQMDIDHEVDVFHAVKMMRINRPQLIDIKDEYKYLYDLLLHWYLNAPEYRQFDKDDENAETNGDGEAHNHTNSLITRPPSSNRSSFRQSLRNSFRRPKSRQDNQIEAK
ncbi:hypothetical protein PFISCL1PPCAC_7283, partial [Pristionchus fissidentatus]